MIKNRIHGSAKKISSQENAVGRNLIIDIEKNGLIISAYKEKEKARNYTFVHRNEIVVALSDFLIVTEADLDSGSLTSVNYALKMGKKVYTIPHRINESLGTQLLIKKGLIEVIYDINEFIENICGKKIEKTKDEIIEFCSTNPIYEEAFSKYSNKIFEYELEGKIRVENGRVYIN